MKTVALIFSENPYNLSSGSMIPVLNLFPHVAFVDGSSVRDSEFVLHLSYNFDWNIFIIRDNDPYSLPLERFDIAIRFLSQDGQIMLCPLKPSGGDLIPVRSGAQIGSAVVNYLLTIEIP